MRVCDLQTGIGRLQRETKRLRDAWQQTKVDWRDATARQFEEQYLQPLLPTLKLTLAAIQELDEAIADAEKACGDDPPR